MIVVDHATPDDASAIAELHIGSWRSAYGQILTAEYLASLSIKARADRWREILAQNESTIRVARCDAQIVGFVSYGSCRDRDALSDQAEIWALYVDPSVWGQGFGKTLLFQALGALRSAGFQRVSLWVFSANTLGRTFYEACGFKQDLGSEQVFELGGLQLQEVRYLIAFSGSV